MVKDCKKGLAGGKAFIAESFEKRLDESVLGVVHGWGGVFPT